ncbi:MAG: FeoB-associated Cys-rich membrane protein [Clostridia bacterium]|nr:FeoB-associated Cys-rich membrane protein [Clostridia bacterium]
MKIVAWIILIAVGILFVACLAYLIYKKVTGKGGGCDGCGGNCAGCSHCTQCRPPEKPSDKEN